MKIVAAAFAEDQKKTTAAAAVQVVDSENQESFTNAEAAAILVIQVHLAVVQVILLQAAVEHIVQVLVKSEEELELALAQAAVHQLQLVAF